MSESVNVTNRVSSILMSKDNNISRRGLFRGDWFKKIRGQAQESEESEFQIKRPKGQMKRESDDSLPDSEKDPNC